MNHTTAEAPAAGAAEAAPAVWTHGADPVRDQWMRHGHRVLGRLLATPALPQPYSVRVEAGPSSVLVELLVEDVLEGGALAPFMAAFGGREESVDRPPAVSEAGYSYPGYRRRDLISVVEGVHLRVWSHTVLPPEAEPVAEAVAEGAVSGDGAA